MGSLPSQDWGSLLRGMSPARAAIECAAGLCTKICQEFYPWHTKFSILYRLSFCGQRHESFFGVQGSCESLAELQGKHRQSALA